MRCALGIIVLAIPCAALGHDEARVGVDLGATTSPFEGLSAGPRTRVALEVNHAGFGLDLGASQSYHPRVRGRGLLVVSGDLGAHYRFDDLGGAPYLSGRFGLTYLPATGGAVPLAALALGLTWPVGERWFAGAELHYGVGLPSGELPVSTGVTLRFGWRVEL
jgi:hypothetical protein